MRKRSSAAVPKRASSASSSNARLSDLAVRRGPRGPRRASGTCSNTFQHANDEILDRGRRPRGPAERPDPPRAARALRSGGRRRHPRQGGLLRRARPVGRHRHVLEHMFFKGTPTRGVGEIARQTKAAGGYLNAGTAYDYTTYYVTLPAAELEAALDIQADALQHASLDRGRTGPRAPGDHPGGEAEAGLARRRWRTRRCTKCSSTATGSAAGASGRNRRSPASRGRTWPGTTSRGTSRTGPSWPSWATSTRRRRSAPPARGTRTGPPAPRRRIARRRSRPGATSGRGPCEARSRSPSSPSAGAPCRRSIRTPPRSTWRPRCSGADGGRGSIVACAPPGSPPASPRIITRRRKSACSASVRNSSPTGCRPRSRRSRRRYSRCAARVPPQPTSSAPGRSS